MKKICPFYKNIEYYSVFFGTVLNMEEFIKVITKKLLILFCVHSFPAVNYCKMKPNYLVHIYANIIKYIQVLWEQWAAAMTFQHADSSCGELNRQPCGQRITH